MNLLPWQFQEINEKYLITNEAGSFFFCSEKSFKNLINKNIDSIFESFLVDKNFLYKQENDKAWNNYIYNLYKRKKINNSFNYLILVPTLRCNLNCSYCQVSRVNENKSGFDWNDEILYNFEKFISNQDTEFIKIEFQGGEPTLRTDLLYKIIDIVSRYINKSEYVVCTNLSKLDKNIIDLFSRENVLVSTSLDGSNLTHQNQRTHGLKATDKFYSNLENLVNLFGFEKVSALPTITNFELINEIIDEYARFGFNSIFLRPVNFQGFARKTFKKNSFDIHSWQEHYLSAIKYIFARNTKNSHKIKEFNFENNLKRIFHAGSNGFVDLRTPNFYGRDYMVIDYDGTFYPTDESRMISRVGLVDMSIGSLEEGLNKKKIDHLNNSQFNETDPDCVHCAYQQFCGVDNIDNISRYNTIDIPKHETFFCNTNTFYFDEIFKMISNKNESEIYNINGHLSNIFSKDNFFENHYYD